MNNHIDENVVIRFQICIFDILNTAKNVQFTILNKL